MTICCLHITNEGIKDLLRVSSLISLCFSHSESRLLNIQPQLRIKTGTVSREILLQRQHYYCSYSSLPCQTFSSLNSIQLYIYRAVFQRIGCQSLGEEDDGGALAEGYDQATKRTLRSVHNSWSFKTARTFLPAPSFASKCRFQSASRSSGRHGGTTPSY